MAYGVCAQYAIRHTFITRVINTKRKLQLTRQQRQKFERIRRLEQIQQLDPVEFEQFVGYLFQLQGYQVDMTVTSGDEGVDLFLQKGRRTAIVQCKRYAGTVGQPTVRDLYGAMVHNNAHEAFLVTSGVVSQPAEAWAQGKPITLIDGHELMSLSRRVHSAIGPLQQALLQIPWRTLGIAVGVLLGLGLLAAALAFGLRTFNRRTAPPPTLTVPTAVAGGDTNPLPPTATLAPTPGSGANPPGTAVPAPTVTLPPAPTGALPVTFLDTPPAIDGALGDWPNLPGVSTPFVVAQANGWDGTRDLDASWQLGWNNTYLFVGVRVQDNVHVQTQPPRLAYQGDSLELQLDTNLTGDYGPALSDDDFQFIFSPGDFATLQPGAFRFRGADSGSMADAPTDAVRVAASRTADGYVLEAAIPWAELGVQPAAGLQLGAALSSNDNDTPDTAVQELMLSHVPTRRWRDPTSWGTLELQP